MVKCCAISLALSRCARRAKTASSRSVKGSTVAAAGAGRSDRGCGRSLAAGSAANAAQELLDIRRRAPAPCQPFQQLDQGRSQVHEDAHKAAGLGQRHRLLEGLQRCRLVALGGIVQRLQGQHIDREARIVRRRDEGVQPLKCCGRLLPARRRVHAQQHLGQGELRGVVVGHDPERDLAPAVIAQLPALSRSPCRAASSAPNASTSGSSTRALDLRQIFPQVLERAACRGRAPPRA